MMDALHTPQSVPGQDLTTRLLYRPSSFVFSMSHRVDAATDRFVSKRASSTSLLQKGLARFVKPIGHFAASLVDWDFREFPIVGKLKLTSVPQGVACFLFFGAMVASRVFVAWQRGKKNGNDFREIKDILIRDSIAISLLLFGLKAITTLFNKFYQKLPGTGGLKLLDPKTGEVLPYSRFANYRLDSERALVSLIREGGGEGLQKAIQQLRMSGLCEVGGDAVQQHLNSILESLPDLVQRVQSSSPADAKAQAEVTVLARKIFKHMEAGDQLLEDLLKSAQQTGLKKAVQMAENVQGTFRNAVIKYAESRRMPADILGFCLVVLMLGWFPGWFNALRNRRDFERMKMQAQATNSFNNMDSRRQTWQTLQANSRLARTRTTQATRNPWMA